MKPKFALSILYVFVFFAIVVLSSAVHEFVHFVQDSGRSHTLCFFGVDGNSVNAPKGFVGWYSVVDGSVSQFSEFWAYFFQLVFTTLLLFVTFRLFWKVYEKL